MIAHRLYVGCIGQGIFRSLDHGQTFRRACDGMPFVECDVRALVVPPGRPEVVYAGTDIGLYVSRDRADSWEKLPAPLDGLQVWSIHFSPARPERLVIGTCPSGILLSEDAGQTWHKAATTMRPDCPRIGWTRVTTILADRDNPDRLWAGVEIDGIHHSEDGGRTWTPVGEGLTSQDIHALALAPAGAGGTRILATTNRDLNVSEDGGRTWRPGRLEDVLPWAYCRSLAQRCDAPEVVLLGGGDGPPGSEGLVALSRDGGRTWARATMPGLANSTLWCFAVSPADPRLIYAASVSGQVYRSLDGGQSWEKIRREFGEVRGLAWAPEDSAA
jgi:photosystem II stability/assembly factor-like uncharacterized protein